MDILFPEGLTPAALILIVIAGFAAGWVDAVVGGGGLLLLPSLLLVPGMTPLQALATNKLGAVFGTTTAAVTFYRRSRPDLRTALPMAAVAGIGGFGGASVAALVPVAVFKPILVVALVAVALFTAFRPSAGALTDLKHSGHRHYVAAGAIGVAIGFYDGLIGPGTGSFLIIAMITVLGYSFLAASGKAKIVNLATNLGALAFFVPHGTVFWGLGLVIGAANIVGGYLGSRMALSNGSPFIRLVFLVVVSVLIVTLGRDVWLENIAPPPRN